MNDPQKKAREIAARHGVKAYEPPAETGKEEPVCEGPRKVTAERDRLKAECEQLRGSLALSMKMELEAESECEQLREFKAASILGAENMGKALSDAIDNEEKLEAELSAARALLEEAREALKPFAQSSIDEPLFRRAVAIIAKIEAAGKPEVKK